MSEQAKRYPFQTRSALALSFACVAILARPAIAVSRSYAANSLIIPMDIDYQDSGMFQGYGLVYKLLTNGVPVD
jgi:hypothetical protein